MAIHYSFEARAQYIYLHGEGTEDGLDENIQIHEMIVQMCKDHDCRYVLIDDRKVTYTASIISIYELAEHYAKANTPRHILKAAVIVNPKYENTNDFFEDTSRNHGINLRLFYDTKKAEQWLTT